MIHQDEMCAFHRWNAQFPMSMPREENIGVAGEVESFSHPIVHGPSLKRTFYAQDRPNAKSGLR